MTARKGHLLRERTYLTEKPYGENYQRMPDVHHTAPAGTEVLWRGGTNEGYEDGYGGTFLYWIELPEFGFSIGAELGADFEWVSE